MSEKAFNKIKEWKDNPVQFVREVFKAEPDEWQKDALVAFASTDENKKRIALLAAVGPGKSTILAWCAWNFLVCYGHRGSHPKGAAISITADNLKDNLWSELSKWRDMSQFLVEKFEWTKERVFAKEFPSTWFLSARSFSKTANSEEQGRTLSGLHSDYVLALIDESGDIPPAVSKAADQALSNCKFGKIIQAGNPTSHDGILYQASTKLRHMWHVIKVTGDPDDPKRSPRIDLSWAKQQIETYGRDNPWVMSSILGMFPPSSLNSLIGHEEVEASMKRSYKDSEFNWSQKRLGIDVSRFGDDRTVIFPRQGLMAFPPVVLRGLRTNEIAARVCLEKNNHKSELEFVDGTGGYGAGVVDALIQSGLSPQEVNFAGKATDPRYANKRAEMWFKMAEWIRRGGALPKSNELIRELTAPTYTFVNGRFQLEPKERIKERLGFSPDISDALCLSFALPDVYLSEFDRFKSGVESNSNKMESDYDPFAR